MAPVSCWHCIKVILTYQLLYFYAGIEWSSTHRSTAVHYPWDKSNYLQNRSKQLSDVMKEIDPYQPV